jgi:hypothetical protein
VGVALLAAVLRFSGVFGPEGQLLTITKPTGGTISGRGIRCGTNGSDCAATATTDEPVQLEVQPDKGFLFAGWTDDCAPTGRTVMIKPRRCGARFESVAAAPVQASYELTVTRPKDGTLVSADILCGTLGSNCSSTKPSGELVKLEAQPDAGFTLQRFTGGCAPNGEMLMTGPRTCGVVFVQSSAVAQPPRPPVVPVHRPEFKPVAPPPPVDIPVAGGQTTPLVPAGLTPTAPLGPGVAPAPPPIPADVTAKNNIKKVLKDFCDAYHDFDVKAMRAVFPQFALSAGELFKQFKSVECTTTGEPEYVKLDAEAGTATVKVAMKMAYEPKAGAAQPPKDFLNPATLSRPEPRGSWHIDTMTFKVKEKDK